MNINVPNRVNWAPTPICLAHKVLQNRILCNKPRLFVESSSSEERYLFNTGHWTNYDVGKRHTHHSGRIVGGKWGERNVEFRDRYSVVISFRFSFFLFCSVPGFQFRMYFANSLRYNMWHRICILHMAVTLLQLYL